MKESDLAAATLDRPRTALVVGGTGFIGAPLVAELRRGHTRTIVAARKATGRDALRIDLDRPELDLKRGAHAFDAVYHVAGLAHHPQNDAASRSRFFTTNVDGTAHLLKALETLSRAPTDFVLASSVSVYGCAEGVALTEDTPLLATDAYGKSKIECELLVRDWCSRHEIPLLIVRLPLAVGPSPPGNLGAMINAMRRRRYFGIGEGGARRSMVSVADVATFLSQRPPASGTIHLTDGLHPTFRDVEAAIVDRFHLRPPRRIGTHLASVIAHIGDAASAYAGIRSPFTSLTLSKMTHTLTFSDALARREFGWRSTPALDALRGTRG